jgi:predicted RNA binding protein YcfA (HicA-like mRNA interferase family)
MLRRTLERHLQAHGCEWIREGANHTVWQNRQTGQRAYVPRHQAIAPGTVRAICRQLGIPQPPGR